MTEFQAWPKIPRLNRNCIVTEKIDGTNACVVVDELGYGGGYTDDAIAVVFVPTGTGDVFGADTGGEGVWYSLYAQSRKRLLRCDGDGDKGRDNMGFAAWVKENALELAAGLGQGRHFGEWWGQGIQRAYGLDEKRFSLFNTGRWYDQHANADDFGANPAPKCCHVVPVLTTGNIINAAAEGALAMLEDDGSFAAPGYDNPEGIVIYHTAARSSFKVTLENDEAAKGTFKGMHSEAATA